MAQRVMTFLEDDLEGGEATQTVTYGLDGTSYEVDLNDKNAQELRDFLGRYIEKSRPVSGGTRRAGTRRRPAAKSDGTAEDPKAIREWARANKIDVPARGRIPETVRLRFREAGN